MRHTIAIALTIVAASATVGCGLKKRGPAAYSHDTQILLQTRKNDIRDCFKAEVGKDAKATGTVKVNFTVAKETGTITKTEVDEESTAPQALQDCVTKNIAGLTMAPPDAFDGIATFTYEFATESN